MWEIRLGIRKIHYPPFKLFWGSDIMSIKSTVITLIAFWVGFTATGLASGPALPTPPKEEKTAMISWQTAYGARESRIIPGTVQAVNGSFPIRWIVGNGNPRLVTLESPGAGELPPVERRLMFLCEANGRTLLLKEWFPLLNVKQPVTIRVMATVPTAELFQVLLNTKVPPVSPLEPVVQPLIWEQAYERNSISYLPGWTNTPLGRLNLVWRKTSGRLPELIMLESLGAGELPPVETSLYIWGDPDRNITVICREHHPRLNENYPSCLWRLATVSTTELMKGYQP
jgi:hypothetical protein